MYLKFLIWLVGTLAVTTTHGCRPSTGEDLKQLWLDLSAEECGHPSMLMLPGFSDLSVKKGESIARFPCNGTEAHCSPDELCASCLRNPMDNVTQDFCNTESPPTGHQPIEIASGCTWHYQIISNKFRYPSILNEAFCNCDYCRMMQEQSEFHCEGVYHKIPVLLATNRDEPMVNDCKYELRYQDLRVGCTCARKPGNQKVVPLRAEGVEKVEKKGKPTRTKRQGKGHSGRVEDIHQQQRNQKCNESCKKCQEIHRNGNTFCKTQRKGCLKLLVKKD